MGLRFQKRISLLKGVTLNLSKSGVSWTIGQRGASINIGKKGVYGNAGLPGTGVSYRERLSNRSGADLGKVVLWLVIIGLVGMLLFH